MKQVIIPASKSISNRLLILQYLFPGLELKNLSTAEDTQVLQKALNKISTDMNSPLKINIGHAGTAMRFLTALLSTLEGREFILDGSHRMRNRPIKILVEALKELGADIKYLEKKGYPPLLIKGKKLEGKEIGLEGSVSSQYISALMLIAPSLTAGLKIKLNGKIVSEPYLEMSLKLLQETGVKARYHKPEIDIRPLIKSSRKRFEIEGDWSSASYFYGLAAVTGKPVIIGPFEKHSLQGDHKIREYFEKLGVESLYMEKNKFLLRPIKNFKKPPFLEFNLIKTPDLAQTLAVSCVALEIPCRLTGLQTLKIKETDRLQALKNELSKFRAQVQITSDSLFIEKINPVSNDSISVPTYEDHRMAMAFAILQKKYDFKIENPEVVSKSFPDFWEKFEI